MDTNISDSNTVQPMNNNNNPVKKVKRNFVKVLAIIGGIVVVLIIICIVVFFVVSANSNKLVCKSNKGNITIMYNDSAITGYTASGVSYDMDGQQTVAEKTGMDSYITQFKNMFETKTGGTCTIKKK